MVAVGTIKFDPMERIAVNEQQLWEQVVEELSQKQLARLVLVWAHKDYNKQAQIFKAMADQVEFGE